MPEYIVKEGAKAFVDGAIRTGGHVVRREKAIEPYPSWAVPAEAAAPAAKKAAAKKGAKPEPVEDDRAPVSFTDADLAANPTIQL